MIMIQKQLVDRHVRAIYRLAKYFSHGFVSCQLKALTRVTWFERLLRCNTTVLMRNFAIILYLFNWSVYLVYSFHQINYFLAVNKTLKSISYIINVSGIVDMKLNLSSFSHFNFSTFTLFSQKKQSLVTPFFTDDWLDDFADYLAS